MKKDNIMNMVVGLVVIFGTTYLISRAWKLGQKDKKKRQQREEGFAFVWTTRPHLARTWGCRSVPRAEIHILENRTRKLGEHSFSSTHHSPPERHRRSNIRPPNVHVLIRVLSLSPRACSPEENMRAFLRT